MSKRKSGFRGPTQSQRAFEKAARTPENPREQGDTANIRQNITHQGRPSGDRV